MKRGLSKLPSFNQRSRRNLDSCDPRLIEVFDEVIKHYDCSVICGHRDKVTQDAAYHSGHSKKTWPNSKHNAKPSRAVDVVPYPIDWEDRERFAQFAGFVLGIATSKGYNMRYGGDWDSDGYTKDHSFSDFPHFEILGD